MTTGRPLRCSRGRCPSFERAIPPTPLTVADTLDDLGYALLLTLRYDEAQRALDRALSIRQAAVAGDDEGTARTLERQAALLHKRGRYADARPLLERALRIRETDARRHVDRAETLNLLGDQHWYEARYDEARGFYVRAAAAASEACGDAYPRLPVYLKNLAQAMADLGDLGGAIATGRRALEIAEANLGRDHPEVGNILNDLAIRQKDLGDYREARALYERALAILSKRSSQRNVAIVIHNLAYLHSKLGDFAEAVRLEKQAIAILEKVLEPQHPIVGTAVYAQALVLSEQHRDLEARPLYERALAIRRRTMKPDDRSLQLTQMMLARTLLRLGDVRGALQLSERAFPDRSHDEGIEDLNMAALLALRAEIELAAR